MSQMKKVTKIDLAKGFVMVSLMLLLVYGIDYALNVFLKMDLLPVNTTIRGILLGGTAVVLSIFAYFLAEKKSLLVRNLLIINGIVMIGGGIIVAIINHFAKNEYGMFLSIGSGIIILILGLLSKESVNKTQITNLKDTTINK